MASQKRKNDGHYRRQERRVTIRGVRRDPPDIGKLSKALIALAMAEAERQAQAEQAARRATPEVTSNAQAGDDADD